MCRAGQWQRSNTDQVEKNTQRAPGMGCVGASLGGDRQDWVPVGVAEYGKACTHTEHHKDNDTSKLDGIE